MHSQRCSISKCTDGAHPFLCGAACVLSPFQRFARGHVGGPGQLQHHGEGAEAAFQHAERGRGPLGECQTQDHVHAAAFKVEILFPVLSQTALVTSRCRYSFHFSPAEGGDWLCIKCNLDRPQLKSFYLVRSRDTRSKCCPCWIRCPRDTAPTPSSTSPAAVQQ